jgi:MFS family permease
MRDKGMSTQQVFIMLFLLLVGGAIGKFVCGWLDERYGSVRIIWGTKGLTAVLLVAALPAPALAMAPLMMALGIGLNGTSSVLYATVAAFVAPGLRSRYYGFFYTIIEVGTAAAPILYGLLADRVEIRTTVVVMGLVTSLVLPASVPLRRCQAVRKLAS